MDSRDTVSSARRRDSTMVTGLVKLEKKLGLDKLFKKKKPGPAAEPEPMVFPPPSFLRPTKIRMLARDDISTAGAGRRTRSLPETPTTSAQVSSRLVSGSNGAQMPATRPSTNYSPDPQVPQRSYSLAPIRRGSSLSGLLDSFNFGSLDFNLGSHRNSCATALRSSPMPSPRTRSRSGSASPSRPISASDTPDKQLDDELEASVCPLQKSLPVPNPIPAPPPADGLLTPPLSAQQDNFDAATLLPHDKHLSLAPLSIPTPETSPCLIPQPESALEEPQIEQTISPQSRRGSGSDLATNEAAYGPEDSPKGTANISTPKELKKAALKESIYSLSSLLQRENASSLDLPDDAQTDLTSTSSDLQGDVQLDLESAATEGKGKAVLKDLDLEDLIPPSDHQSENRIYLSDNESDNAISHDLQRDVPFAATSKAAEEHGRIVREDLAPEDPISHDLQGNVPIGFTSNEAIEKHKALLRELAIASSISPGDGENEENSYTSKNTESAFITALICKQVGDKIMAVLQEPSLRDFFTLSDDDLSEDDDSTKAQPPSPVRHTIIPDPPRRRLLPGSSVTISRPREAERRVILSPPLASPPAVEAAIAAARIARRFGFDVIYVVNLWPANIGLSQSLVRKASAPMATSCGSQQKSVTKKASASSLSTLATVIHRPSAISAPKSQAEMSGAAAHKSADYRLAGRLLAGHGLQHVAAPFTIPELMHKQVLRAEDWLEYRSSDPFNPDLFSRGYMHSFYTGHSSDDGWRAAAPSQEGMNHPGPEINRGIVFAAYRLQRDDGIVVESYRPELEDVRKEAQNLVDMVFNISTTLDQRT